MSDQTPNVLGLSEVATLLGVSRQRADQLRHDPLFPPPIAKLRAGSVWDAVAVREFQQKRQARMQRQGHGAEAATWRGVADQLAAAVEGALKNADVPAFYGEGSWWEALHEALARYREAAG